MNLQKHIPEGSTIIKSELVTNYNSTFVRVFYTVPKEYQEHYGLYYQNRYIDILLVAGEGYEGAYITSCGCSDLSR